jgi:hypothetical protein
MSRLGVTPSCRFRAVAMCVLLEQLVAQIDQFGAIMNDPQSRMGCDASHLPVAGV